jgi:hypothetical protein
LLPVRLLPNLTTITITTDITTITHKLVSTWQQVAGEPATELRENL